MGGCEKRSRGGGNRGNGIEKVKHNNLRGDIHLLAIKKV